MLRIGQRQVYQLLKIKHFQDMKLTDASSTYIHNSHNIILKGPTGSGKSFLATAFGISACRQFYNVKYIRLPELLDELTLTKLAVFLAFT